tara:strand:- start:609 stop:1292 length:684 start_codon:yes stop_codon:yes gene_type:complete
MKEIMTIKKGDFIEIDYVGRIKNSEEIFDLTKKDIADKEGIVNNNTNYSPKILCVGQGDIVRGLDDFFVGKDAGKEYDVCLSAEEGFGKKNAKLIRLVPISVFKKQKINPVPSMQLNIDGRMGIVKTASGGRVLVDFNHPLSGKDLKYHLEIKRIVKDDGEKVGGVIKGLIGKDVKCVVDKGVAKIDFEFPDAFKKAISDRIKEIVIGVKEIKFTENKDKKKTNTQK